jgi:hypothetical protein
MDLPPIVRAVRELDGEYYLTSEVSQAIGIPAPTLRKLAKGPKAKELGPSQTMLYGQVRIGLYSPADLRRLAAHFKDEKAKPSPMGRVGRPRLWTVEEQAERQRRFNLAQHYRRQAKRLRPTDPLAAKLANNQSRILIRGLRNEAKVRRAQNATR